VTSFRETWLTDTMARSSLDGRPMVYGITPDGVEGVDLVLASGETVSAHMGRNSYFWLGQPRERATEIAARLEDGETRTRSIPTPAA
jgi:hypothetical protein